MALVRKILFPFAILYGLVTALRNFLFDKGILKSHSFDLPLIAVGNLSVGGTGKTPQIEYLIRLLSTRYRLATLSRGYKRHSKGFVLADKTADAMTIGDEPYQYYTKFPGIIVAVDADRKNGIQRLLSLSDKPELVLLDDAYQHRKVRAGFYILLTAYNDLYTDDYMLPTGNLRESRSGANRADMVIVTKCPPDLSPEQREFVRHRLGLAAGQQLYFTYIRYDDLVYSATGTKNVSDIKAEKKLLVAGIAKPAPFFEFLQQPDDIAMPFPDHHEFTEADIAAIQNNARDRIIITTEKDYMRLSDRLPAAQLFYLPIQTAFVADANTFDSMVSDYVERQRIRS